MKLKNLFAVLVLLAGGAAVAHAQLTTGNPTSKVIQTGNRAQAGDFGIYLGATTTMFGNMFNDKVDLTPLPLINFKYMSSDNFEWRVGLEAYKLSETLNGEADMEKETSVSNNKYNESTLLLYPGFAYHFSRFNILDVYVGAEIPMGWDASTFKSDMSYGQYEGSSTTTKRSFVLGLGAFIGLQAYIADLPLAIGVEYGISSRLDAGLKYKNVTVSENTTTTTYSTVADSFKHLSPTSDAYSKLTARKGEIGSQVRFTLSYYFK